MLKEQSDSAAGNAADEILDGWSNMRYGSVRGAHCFHVKMKRIFSMLILSHGNTLSARAAHAYFNFCINIASDRKCLCSGIFIFCSSAFTTAAIFPFVDLEYRIKKTPVMISVASHTNKFRLQMPSNITIKQVTQNLLSYHGRR